MKKWFTIGLVMCAVTFIGFSQNIGINSENALPDESAILDVSSTTKGLLIPRMTTIQRNAIPNPAMSLLIFNTDTKCYEGYNSDEGEWYSFGCFGDSGGNNPGETGTFPSDFVDCGFPTLVQDVSNPTTGRTWMDRNLGASQVATEFNDVNAYGDLYQWGRFADGHQCRTSVTTTQLSSTDTPNHGNFIVIATLPADWRSPQNDNLWQGVNGVNNPCPSGYRVPTSAELDQERLSWSSNNREGAFASPLKIPCAGFRRNSSGDIESVGSEAYLWSSVVSEPSSSYPFGANHLYVNTGAGISQNDRAEGFSIRCIKE